MTDIVEENTQETDKSAAEVKKLKEQLKKATDALKAAASETEAAKTAAEEAEEAKARAAGDMKALEETLTKKFQKQIAEANAKLEEREASLKTMLIDNAIAAKLVEHNIKPAFHEHLKQSLKSQATLHGTEAVIGDKTIAEYFNEFASSETGKDFILAPSNTGSGATGGSGSAARMTKETFDMTKFLAIAAANPAEANALADQMGMPHLKA